MQKIASPADRLAGSYAHAHDSFHTTGSRADERPQPERSRIRIGLSTHALAHGGGIERYVRDLIGGLAARGAKPVVFARRLDMSLPESQFVEPYLISGSFLPGKIRDYWFSWRLRKARQETGVDVLIACNRVDTAEIGICGGTHIGSLRAAGRRPTPSDHLQIALERRYYGQAKIIIAHSKLMSDELQELYGVEKSKICVLYPPVDSARFTPVDSARRRILRVLRFDCPVLLATVARKECLRPFAVDFTSISTQAVCSAPTAVDGVAAAG